MLDFNGQFFQTQYKQIEKHQSKHRFVMPLKQNTFNMKCIFLIHTVNLDPHTSQN